MTATSQLTSRADRPGTTSGQPIVIPDGSRATTLAPSACTRTLMSSAAKSAWTLSGLAVTAVRTLGGVTPARPDFTSSMSAMSDSTASRISRAISCADAFSTRSCSTMAFLDTRRVRRIHTLGS